MALCSLSTGRIATPLRLRRVHDQPARHDEHFFVGQRDRLAGFDRRQHRVERGRAGRGAQHEIDVGMRRDCDEAVVADAETSAGDPPSAATSLSIASPVAIATALRPELEDLLRPSPRRSSPAASATTSTRSAMRARNVERARADGAGGAENGDARHVLKDVRRFRRFADASPTRAAGLCPALERVRARMRDCRSMTPDQSLSSAPVSVPTAEGRRESGCSQNACDAHRVLNLRNLRNLRMNADHIERRKK